ncbi:methyltransferase domain-containing protein [Castellaniella caeni]|uniref:spermine/spermidine synthase domain-containing protein n=1 Tax=Castellaniella caeni TaxID=266123 RepID=UPI0008318842|nr:methyltransferase domain-containing protein [Castellaniella caeni]
MKPKTIVHLAWFLSFWTGFISLSEEIIWVRLISFAYESTPRAFAVVLTAFLVGIALGAIVGKRLSEKQRATPLTAAWLLLLAGTLLLLLPNLIAWARVQPGSIFLMLVMITAGAALKGTLFPIVHHLGSSLSQSLGQSVSRTYFSNILGSTLGPLVTGLILLDAFPSGTSLQLLGLLCLAVSIPALSVALRSERRGLNHAAWVYGLCALALLPWVHPTGDNLTRRLAMAPDGAPIRMLIGNRHGIIHSVQGPHDDIVFGGNVYDGRTNTDLAINDNLIDRAYLLYGLHPNPRRVLVIGLSSGAWTRLITSIPGVQSIDVVEINPGYLQMIRSYPHLAPLLDDPRLRLHIDDGRRWLRRDHGQFDLIVMNTTFHWRANATNLLSREMMQMIRQALAPGGVFAFNATDSRDAFYTATQVFPFTYRFRSFVYTADHDLAAQLPHLRDRIRQFQLDGQPLLPDTPVYEQALASLAGTQFTRIEQVVAESPRPLMTVTDQNMITEFRFGRGTEE